MVERGREDVFFLYTVSCRVSWCAPPPSSFSNFSRSLPPTPTIVYAGQYLHFTTVSWCVPPSHFLSNFNRLLPPPLPPSIVQGQYRHVLLKWVVGWGVWGGESFLHFCHDAMRGYQVYSCCSNFHEIIELFSIPVKWLCFSVYCVRSVWCTVFVVWDSAQSVFV